MKVNLLIDNPTEVRNGYLNVDPYAEPNDAAGRIAGDLSNLNQLVDDGEVDELVAHKILSYYPQVIVAKILEHWVRKLAYGGTITVSALDQNEVARHIQTGYLTLEDANTLLHGAQERDWDTVKSSFTVTRLADSLKGLGLQIVRKRSSDYQAMVTARRPQPNKT